ncbi:hypothetical protein BJ166DRAFT_579113 [Pestalotiopsis sp. NC0098]|nr:hypothetical protein BJ166DRAFT_579113 [Pestalotiopsis sp. NC0098]
MASPTVSPKRTVTHALIGFGPRNATLFKHAVVAYVSERALFQKMGLELAFYIFDEAEQEYAAQGQAWRTECEGNANSGIPISAPLRGVEKIQEDWMHILKQAINFEDSASRDLVTYADTLADQYKKINPAAYALLRESTLPGGAVDTTAPWGTRASIGLLLQKSVFDVIEFVRTNIPEIQIHMNWGLELFGMNLTNPQRPVLAMSFGLGDTMTFDYVHIAQGLSKHPSFGDRWMDDEYWSEFIHLEPANYDGLLGRLQLRGLLTEGGTMIKPRAKIAIAGLSLSAYDYVPILMQFTDMLELTDEGWRINVRNARKYEGLLTFIAPDGRVAPPCHYPDRTNPSGSNYWPRENSLISTEELHALHMQQEFDWMTVALPLLRASVCLELDRPLDLNDPALTRTPLQQMRDYREQNERYQAGHQTEIGLLRLGQQLFFEGHGLERYPATANAALLAKAPFTHVSGPMARKSLLSEMSLLKVASKSPRGNRDMWKYFKSLDSASPVQVQDLVAQLFDLGVAVYAKGKMEQMKPARGGRHVALDNEHWFHLVIAPQTNTTDAWNKRIDQGIVPDEVVLMEDPNLINSAPAITKGRFWLDTRTSTEIHVIDAGSGSAGHLMSKGDIEAGWIVGARDSDNDTLTGIFDWAPTAARYLVLLSVLTAGGADRPPKYVLASLENTLPKDDVFEREMAQFEGVWNEVVQKYAFIDFCHHLKGRIPPNLFKNVYDPDRRAAAIEEINRLLPGSRFYYDQRVAQLGPYKPLTWFDHLNRHVDLTPDQMDEAWLSILNQTREIYK